jgi:hypothetical protein
MAVNLLQKTAKTAQQRRAASDVGCRAGYHLGDLEALSASSTTMGSGSILTGTAPKAEILDKVRKTSSDYVQKLILTGGG